MLHCVIHNRRRIRAYSSSSAFRRLLRRFDMNRYRHRSLSSLTKSRFLIAIQIVIVNTIEIKIWPSLSPAATLFSQPSKDRRQGVEKMSISHAVIIKLLQRLQNGEQRFFGFRHATHMAYDRSQRRREFRRHDQVFAGLIDAPKRPEVKISINIS